MIDLCNWSKIKFSLDSLNPSCSSEYEGSILLQMVEHYLQKFTIELFTNVKEKNVFASIETQTWKPQQGCDSKFTPQSEEHYL